MSGAMNLPYLRPADPVSTTVCVARVREASIELAYPELRDDFRTLVKRLGFLWEDRVWRKDINMLTGPATDRAADTAVTLVEAGFIVDLRDAAAHAMAIDGTYAPEVTRWITGGPKDHPDHCRIRWRRDEDFYRLARSLPGSRYVNGCVLVPYTSIEAVADFAERTVSP